jgi:signal transduction histidine kinase
MKWKILVVEDAHALRKDIMEMLRFEGFEVIGAENGLVGLNAARTHLPDLIICDIMMPELDGFGMLAELQKNPLEATIPFVFLTALTDKKDWREGMRLGANDYLTKPFTAQELIQAVYTQLNKRIKFDMLSESRMDQLRENIMLALPHELRTPLTGILGFSDLLAMDAGFMEPAQTSEMAGYINAAAQRLYRLTENYVLYTQIEVTLQDKARASAMRQYVTAFPGETIHAQVIRQASACGRETDLQCRLVEDIHIMMFEDHLRKIVEELVDNAFKFSSAGKPVSVVSSIEGQHYVLTVTDQGRGFAPQHVRDIGPYSQFGRKQHEQQGSGFGLAIVKRLAQLHGGEFEVELLPGPSTRVTVRLPLAEVAEAEPAAMTA